MAYIANNAKLLTCTHKFRYAVNAKMKYINKK